MTLSGGLAEGEGRLTLSAGLTEALGPLTLSARLREGVGRLTLSVGLKEGEGVHHMMRSSGTSLLQSEERSRASYFCVECKVAVASRADGGAQATVKQHLPVKSYNGHPRLLGARHPSVTHVEGRRRRPKKILAASHTPYR